MVSGLAVRRRIKWDQTFRIIRSIFPPIDLFEDIADPRDWEALVAVEEKTNPRIRFEIGDLGKVPAARRVSGDGASLVMAPFVHCSILRPGRFTDGSYGIYYAGQTEEVALAETIHHHQNFMRSTKEPAGWTADFRVLIGKVDRDLDDVNAVPVFCIPTITRLHISRAAASERPGATASSGKASACRKNGAWASSGRTQLQSRFKVDTTVTIGTGIVLIMCGSSIPARSWRSTNACRVQMTSPGLLCTCVISKCYQDIWVCSE